eukprot:379380_1
MSTRSNNTKSLIFGYIKQNSKNNVIPEELIHYIKCFYNEWTYWVIKKEELPQYTNATTPIITQHIKGITFTLKLKPHENETISNHIVAEYAVTNLPSNIEYIQAENLLDSQDGGGCYVRIFNVNQSKQNKHNWYCNTNELDIPELQHVMIDWKVVIRRIMYKHNCNKRNYHHPSYYMRKYTYSTQIVSLRPGFRCSQYSFNNNRYFVAIMHFPAVTGRCNTAYANMMLCQRSVVFGIKSIDAKIRVIVKDELNRDIEPYYVREIIWNFKQQDYSVFYDVFDDDNVDHDEVLVLPFIPFDEFKQKK